MDKIALIRAEIERLAKVYQDATWRTVKGETAKDFRDKLLAFIDSLPDEPDKDLEEAAEEYIKKGYLPVAFVVRPAFIAGAKWQAEQDDRDVVFWKGMKYAIDGMKEDAVDGIYTKSIDGKNVFVESGALKIDPESVKVGDPVKLIIIKDNESD